MHVHTTGMGTGYGHQPTTNLGHIYNQPPPATHVTMNINMNMYSNVMNINLNDTPSSNSAPPKQTNLADHMKLDINDFTVKPATK